MNRCVTAPCGSSNVDQITLMLENVSISMPDFQILKACYINDSKLFELAISNGASVDAAKLWGETCLMISTQFQDAVLTERLLQLGADDHRTNQYGDCALTLACNSSNIKAIELLLEYGKRYSNIHQNQLNDALTHMCKFGSLLIVKMLVEAGADVNTQDGKGFTSLMGACMYNKLQIISYLLYRKVDREAQDQDGNNALYYACTANKKEVVKLLLKIGVDVDRTNQFNQHYIRASLLRGYAEIADMLMHYHLFKEIGNPYDMRHKVIMNTIATK